jgi:hypothetical protein
MNTIKSVQEKRLASLLLEKNAVRRRLMFDQNFDPYDALQLLNNNVRGLDQNLAALINAHNLLAKRVEEQSEVIDVLTKGLNNANTANQILMTDLLSNMTEKIKDLK